jgi:prefoldin subunit 5
LQADKQRLEHEVESLEAQVANKQRLEEEVERLKAQHAAVSELLLEIDTVETWVMLLRVSPATPLVAPLRGTCTRF